MRLWTNRQKREQDMIAENNDDHVDNVRFSINRFPPFLGKIGRADTIEDMRYVFTGNSLYTNSYFAPHVEKPILAKLR